MPAYDFRCPNGHTTEHVQSIHDPIPEAIECQQPLEFADASVKWAVHHHDGVIWCGKIAERVFAPPAAIHYRGRGFYATDVKGAQERKRRPNPGDDLFIGHDPQAAAIARSR